uniref:Zinc finger and BTB domain containing 22 n=1 Tax=Laticauda laticaudata TaxID=8630 RepID=A0A8C5SYS0_LATLA
SLPGRRCIRVAFPEATSALLEALNQQRVEGSCATGHPRAGRASSRAPGGAGRLLALLPRPGAAEEHELLVLPSVMDPAFELVLGSAYTGRLVLQMWHIVDNSARSSCSRSASAAPTSPGGGRRDPPPPPAGGAAGRASRAAPGRPCARLRPPEPFARRAAAEPDDDAASDGGEAGSSEARRPAYARPSLVPQRQWVPVKKERGGRAAAAAADEEPAEPAALSISDVRTLSASGPPEEQVNFCESSQDVALAPPARLPLDLPAGPLLLFPAGASGGPAGSPASVEHGAVQLPGASGEGNKIFLCHCGKAFSHKSMRDRHVNMHLNLRPFDCPVCNKKFKMKHHLTEHMKTHTGLKPYQCLVCAKKFMWRDSFMRHKGHCERRHRLGPARKEASPPRLPGEAEWAAGRSPRSDAGLPASKM